MYTYQAIITHIHDGDTIDMNVDLGFSTWHQDRFRFYGINAPELSTQPGKDALAYLMTLIKVGDTLTVTTYPSSKVALAPDEQEKYGRYLATLVRADGLNINEDMVSSGHAVVYLPK